eukprot:TRINITY_DN48684_c0_g1_i1.p1 TRINITY_DN48684_c0_g1~~TRINITY_DN48684_c0_g1_i1.p1  ORF type:complete len:411 (+),score=78.68 TRINITY_DN48684_c0_g1_i1:98-1330(+)
MGRNNAATVVLCVVAVSCSAGTKLSGVYTIKGEASGQNLDGQNLDGLSLLTQLQQVVTARASASIHHAATPEYLSNMVTMASNLARMSNAGISDSSNSPFTAIKESMKATITNILDVRVDVDFIGLKRRMEAFTKLFSACETQFAKGNQAAAAKQQEVPCLTKRHASCRAVEAVKFADKNACNASLQTSRLVQTTGCDIVIHYGQDESTSLCAPKLTETAEQYNRRMVAEFKSRLDTIRSQKSLCQNASVAVSSQQNACAKEERDLQQQRQSCNRIQETLDSKACEVGMMMNSTCQAYQACRTQTMYSWSLAHNTTEWSVHSLRQEYMTLRKVECLLDSLGAEQSQLELCLTQPYDGSHLQVNSSAPLECQACQTLAELPGTPEYEQAVFASLPPEAPAAPCTASCCIDI